MSRKPIIPYSIIISAYQEMGSALKVAEKLGISDQTVYFALKQSGVAAGGIRRPTVTDAQIIEAYERLRDGNLVAKLLHTNSVWRVLKAHGVPRDGHKKLFRDDPSIARILEKYESGVSAKQIAKLESCSTEAVLNLLKSRGVSIRSPKPHLSQDEKHKLRDLYAGGKTFAEAAAEIGCHVNTALRIINDEYPEIVRSHLTGPGGPHWKGGVSTDSQGYVQEWVSRDDPFFCMATRNGKSDAGYAPQHRLVMARKLGRPLLSTETVHHIDGEKSNNDPGNLQLRHGKHGKHSVKTCTDCGSSNVGQALLIEGKHREVVICCFDCGSRNIGHATLS